MSESGDSEDLFNQGQTMWHTDHEALCDQLSEFSASEDEVSYIYI